MVLHLITNADFTNYQYHEVYIPGAKSVTVNGETFTTVSDITLPIGVNTSGGTSGDVYLIGKKKPEALNTKKTDGSYPIR